MKLGDLVLYNADYGTIMKIYDEEVDSLFEINGGPDFNFGEVGLVLDVKYIVNRHRLIPEGQNWVKLHTHRGVGWVREDSLGVIV